MKNAVYLTALTAIILGLCNTSALAQDEEKKDPYSDYSYLWEEEKKDKKKKKKKKKEPAPTVQADTIKVPSDSLILVSDTIPTSDSLAYVAPSDSIPVDSVREKKGFLSDVKPVNDFRSGMAGSGGGSFTGGVTYTQIGGQGYVGLVLNPEFSIGKVGVGLNVPILYGLDDQSIRTEMFKDGVGPVRLIRYVRYGVQKKDPVYVKVGELSGTMIGYGGLINNYTNTTSYEKRKVGIHYDLNYKYGFVGLEGLYSDFDPTSLNLLSLRPYTRPLIWMDVPIIRTLEVGATFVRDQDQTAQSASESGSTYAYTKNGISAFGLDAGVVLLSVPFIQIDLFAQYSELDVSSDTLDVYAMSVGEMLKKGSGISAGMNFRFHFIANVLSTDIRIERLSYKDHYLPQFFDATYELNKDVKIQSLVGVENVKGIYGSLTGHILQTVRLGGSLLLPDNITPETPATVRVSADVERLADKFSFHGSYIKGGLTDLGDAFEFDSRSLAKARFVYHLNRFLATGVDYYYYWERQEDTGEYKATRYVMPYFGVSIQF